MYVSHVDSSALVFSLSSYRHSYIGLVFSSLFVSTARTDRMSRVDGSEGCEFDQWIVVNIVETSPDITLLRWEPWYQGTRAPQPWALVPGHFFFYFIFFGGSSFFSRLG